MSDSNLSSVVHSSIFHQQFTGKVVNISMKESDDKKIKHIRKHNNLDKISPIYMSLLLTIHIYLRAQSIRSKLNEEKVKKKNSMKF